MDVPRPVRVALVACAAWLVLHEVRVVLAPDLDLWPLTWRFAHVVVLLAASGLCLARAASPARGPERAAWGLIGAGVLAWSLGELYYTAVLWDETDPAIPSPADAGFLLFPPLLLAGAVLLLCGRAQGIRGRARLDGLIAALGVSAVGAALVLDTVAGAVGGRPLAVATSLAYPVSDVLLLALFVGALAGTGRRLDRTWILLVAGVSTFWLADSLYLVETAQGAYMAGGWFDAGWWAGLLLIAAAAWMPAPAPADEDAAEDPLRAIALPLGFGLAGLGVLVLGPIEPLNPLAAGLAGGCVVAVMARAALVFRENAAMLRAAREETLIDPLTGLRNRRALTCALAERLPDARPSRPLVLALFDLDGFKAYNDTFGHPAGDALLARLGGNLAALLEGRGHAFRMGGDEFCALFEATDAEDAEPLVLSAAAALSEHGDGFSVGCSHGAVTLPAEAREGADALRIADRRMYAHKQANHAPASRQSADVLLRALAERHPGLGTHAEAVALAMAVAEALGLRPEGVECVRQAAELHDVGKVAIPDAILGKPGPLSETEWAFVRRHPAIGERIVLAAPALARVGALVRASHERWDGLGYPDGLRGEAISVGARIVAVADAFAAMTAGRPYRAALTPDEALAELRRAAGAQFDAEVVEAWCAARAQRAVPAG